MDPDAKLRELQNRLHTKICERSAESRKASCEYDQTYFRGMCGGLSDARIEIDKMFATPPPESPNDKEWEGYLAMAKERNEQRARADALANQIGDARDAGEIAPDESLTAGVRDLRLRAEKAEAALAEARGNVSTPKGKCMVDADELSRIASECAEAHAAVRALARELARAQQS